MLLKLWKNEFRSTWGFMLTMSVIALGLSAIAKAQLELVLKNGTGNQVLEVISMIYMVLFVLAMAVINAAVFIFLIGRFHRKMYTDQAYLMQTLPVTKNQHILSQLINSYFWMAEFLILDGVCFFLVIWETSWTFREIVHNVLETLDMVDVPALTVVLLIITAAVSPVQMILMWYCAISLGQIMKNHHVIGTVLMYFVIQFAAGTLTSVVGDVLRLPLGGLHYNFWYFDSYQYYSRRAKNMIAAFNESLLVGLVIILLECVLFWLITRRRLEKHLDLQ